MSEIKEIVCQPFIKLSKDEMGRVKYLYEMTAELEWGNPDQVETLMEEAQERGLIKLKENEDTVELNYEYKYHDLIPLEERNDDITRFKQNKPEKPIENPNTKNEKVINKLVEEHGIDQQIAASKVNKINKENEIEEVEETVEDILSRLRN